MSYTDGLEQYDPDMNREWDDAQSVPRNDFDEIPGADEVWLCDNCAIGGKVYPCLFEGCLELSCVKCLQFDPTNRFIGFCPKHTL